MKTKNGKATFKNNVEGAMKRRKYEPKGEMLTSPVMAKMRAIAFDPSTARKIINRQDNLHNDDAAEAAAQAKRERKQAQRAALAQPMVVVKGQRAGLQTIANKRNQKETPCSE